VIGKPRGRAGMLPVWVYNPALGRKVYVGQRPTMREATVLEAEKVVEFAQLAPRKHGQDWTVAGWREHWLREFHGENTKRPEPTTYRHNEQATRAFVKTHGGRKLRAISRAEAEAHARYRPHEARILAAMFADAVRIGHLVTSVFAGLGADPSAGRDDIEALTAEEIATLERLALREHGRNYGRAFADFIVCAAWIGWRPGEACGLERTEVDLRSGLVKVHWQRRNDGTRARTKTKRNRTVVVAGPAEEALARRMRASKEKAVFLSPTGKPTRPNSIRYFWVPVRAAFLATLSEDHWLPRRLRQDPDDHLDPYELRHFCGSHLADQGLTPFDISAHLGNSEKVCRVYIHGYKDRQRDRIRAALGNNIRDLCSDDGQRFGQRGAADVS